MTTENAIASRNKIARAALNADPRYSFRPIGEMDDDVNDMEELTGLRLVHRITATCDVAVYSDGSRHMLVCDANGPISIAL